MSETSERSSITERSPTSSMSWVSAHFIFKGPDCTFERTSIALFSVSDTLTSEVATTFTDSLFRLNESKTCARKP